MSHKLTPEEVQHFADTRQRIGAFWRLANQGMRRLLESGYFWLILVATTFSVCVVLTICFWSWLHPASPTTVSNSETLRNAGLLIGGLLAFVFAGWRAWVAERQSNAAQQQAETALQQAETALQQAETALQQAETAQQTLLNERYQRGAEMIGSNVLAVRMGGIAALKRLSDSHPNQYHIPVMELFCAFIRDPTRLGDGTEEPPPQWHPLLGDFQAAISAILHRSEEGLGYERTENFVLDLHNAALSEIDLSHVYLKGANLKGVILQYTPLTHANLSGADLQNAKLWRANLTCGKLSHTRFLEADLSEADLSRADLRCANLSHVNLSAAQLLGADLTGANLSGAILGTAQVFGEIRSTCVTQAQLDSAKADTKFPPRIEEGTVDVKTGELLVWRGQPLESLR